MSGGAKGAQRPSARPLDLGLDDGFTAHEQPELLKLELVGHQGANKWLVERLVEFDLDLLGSFESSRHEPLTARNREIDRRL